VRPKASGAGLICRTEYA